MEARSRLSGALLIAGLLVAACSGGGSDDPTASPLPPSLTAPPPTATQPPVAALVDGSPIRLSDYEAEVRRYEAAQQTAGIDLATLGNYRAQLLQALIDRRLLALGAQEAGFELTEETLSQKTDQLVEARGGSEAMGAWLAEHAYTLESFERALRDELLAAEMVARITAGVPEETDQVHARHILVASRSEAENLLAQLEDGADFAELAVARSLDLSTRLAGGDLGWFPLGYLTVPELAAAAFALEPEQIGPVVETALGFHIVQTLERGTRVLAPDALRALQQLAVEDWLRVAREQRQIELFVVP